MVLWQAWVSFKGSENPFSGTLLSILGLFLLILGFYVKRFAKRTIEVNSAGIAIIDGKGTRTFIGWDEMADFSAKTRMRGLVLFLFDHTGNKKISINGFKEFPIVTERVFDEFVKRMPSPVLPLTFKWFPSRFIKINREGIQFRNHLNTETLDWAEIDRLMWE